jgi:hypothetical protein
VKTKLNPKKTESEQVPLISERREMSNLGEKLWIPLSGSSSLLSFAISTSRWMALAKLPNCRQSIRALAV